jgi:uncharacterized damage-inducible protein DinB
VHFSSRCFTIHQTKTIQGKAPAMSETERIIDQFRRAFDGNAWHGPSVLPLISDVTAAQAAAHPVAGTHSIWELVLHIGAWESACKRRLEGDPAQLTDEEDWMSIKDFSQEEWERTKQKLVQTHEELLASIAEVNESRLDQPIIGGASFQSSSVYVTLHGAVQHDLYHAGQIALLKKAIASVEGS